MPGGEILRFVVNDEKGVATPDGASRVFAGACSDRFVLGWLGLPRPREDTMIGWFDSLFGRTSEPANILARFKRKVTRAPTDPDLLKIAKDRKGHISRRAVRDEYNRLLLEKYAHDKA